MGRPLGVRGKGFGEVILAGFPSGGEMRYLRGGAVGAFFPIDDMGATMEAGTCGETIIFPLCW